MNPKSGYISRCRPGFQVFLLARIDLELARKPKPVLEIITRHGYIPHVVSRTQEKKARQRHPGKKARR